MANGEEMAEVRFLVPVTWRDALVKLARSQRIALADLMRIMVRGFMRERLTDKQRRELDVD